MDLNAIAEYLPLFGEAALLTVKLGVLGIIFSIIIGLYVQWFSTTRYRLSAV